VKADEAGISRPPPNNTTNTGQGGLEEGKQRMKKHLSDEGLMAVSENGSFNPAEEAVVKTGEAAALVELATLGEVPCWIIFSGG